MAHKEQLSVQSAKRWISQLDHVCSYNQGLSTKANSLLSDVFEYCRLVRKAIPSGNCSSARQVKTTYVDKIMKLRQYPDGFLQSWEPGVLFI